MLFRILCFLALAACTRPGSWTLEKIAAGNHSYDLSRLVFQDKSNQSPLRLELIKMGESSDLIISLTQYSISPSHVNPLFAHVRFSIGDDPPFEEMVQMNQGKMRLHPSIETCDKLIKALQDGLKIDIVVDDVEESISPQGFAKCYEEFSR